MRCLLCGGKYAPVRSEGGDVIGHQCQGCHKLLGGFECIVCRRPFVRMATHHKLTSCGRFASAGLWWTPARPSWAPYSERRAA